MRIVTFLAACVMLFAACSSGDGAELRDAPIESAEVVKTGDAPLQFAVLVVAQIPGSSCHLPQEPAVERDGRTFRVTVQNLFTGAEACTADLGYRELTIPLPGEFEAGVEYTVVVNQEAPLTLVAGSG